MQDFLLVRPFFLRGASFVPRFIESKCVPASGSPPELSFAYVVIPQCAIIDSAVSRTCSTAYNCRSLSYI